MVLVKRVRRTRGRVTIPLKGEKSALTIVGNAKSEVVQKMSQSSPTLLEDYSAEKGKRTGDGKGGGGRGGIRLRKRQLEAIPRKN